MIADTSAVELRGLVKRYGEIVAVDHVDLSVPRGTVFGYLGPNGAGKPTSLRMMLGLVRPSEGSVRLFGRDPHDDTVRALAPVAGFVEAPRFYPYSECTHESGAVRGPQRGRGKEPNRRGLGHGRAR